MHNPDYAIYEVFIQRSHNESHVHVGSLGAPTDEMALQMARENFGRRESIVNIWIVKKEYVVQTQYERDFFLRSMDRSYREVKGYTENGRLWRMFKEKALTLDEMIRFIDQKKESEMDKGGV